MTTLFTLMTRWFGLSRRQFVLQMFGCVGFSPLSFTLSRKWDGKFALAFALAFHLLSGCTDGHQRFRDRRQIHCRILQPWGLLLSKNTREVAGKIVNSSWQRFQFTPHKTLEICRIHIGFIINTICVCPLVTSREGTAVTTWVRRLFSSLIRWRGPVWSFLDRREYPSDSRCSLMCSSGNSLTKTRFTSLIAKCLSANAAIKRSRRSCVKLAFLISIQPGTSSIVTRFMSLYWRVLIPSSNLVTQSVMHSPRFLWSLFETKYISRLSPFFCGRCCPSSASSLVIKASMPRRFLSALRSKLSVMLRAVGSNSWSVIARPTRRAAPLRPPTSRAATDELLAGSHASHWDRRPIA